MATFRTVKTSFWTDRKIVDEFSPEDKYFFLYLLTNPRTTQVGIYEFVPKLAAFDLGWSKDAVMVLLDRFENKYNIIRYSNETGEIAIKNFLLHSIIKGGKPVMDCLIKETSQVKDKSLIKYIYNHISNIDNLNNTIKDFIQYLEGYIYDNDNDNERIVDDTYHDTLNDVQDIDTLAEELFNSLWNMYPKKRGKGSVSATQKRRLYEIGFDSMVRCIERYNAEIQGKDNKYIKNGSTFFNSGYVDYLDENYTPLRDTSNDAILAFLNAEDD